MSALQITAVLLRIFAIWCALDSMSWLITLWDPNQSDSYGRTLTLIYTLLYAMVALVLWAFPSLIARKMLIATGGPSTPAADPKSLLNVAVVAVGLLILAQSLPDMLSAAAVVLEVTRSDDMLRSERISFLLRASTSLLRPILGLLLLLKAPAVTRRLWPRVQERGAGDA
jgi:hypothetical protein